MKKPVGRPKSETPKKHLGLRLDLDVIAIIRSKPNQVRYIEELVKESIVMPSKIDRMELALNLIRLTPDVTDKNALLLQAKYLKKIAQDALSVSELLHQR